MAPYIPWLCRIGWHAPLPGPTWNEGYYFSRCRRCGIDLVRTTYSGWQVPRGYRVVWRVGPPDEQEVRRTAAVDRTAPPAPARARGQRPPQRPSAIPDFMDDPAPGAPRLVDPLRSSAKQRRLPPG